MELKTGENEREGAENEPKGEGYGNVASCGPAATLNPLIENSVPGQIQ